MYRIDNVSELLQSVTRTGGANYARIFTEELLKSRINGLFQVSTLDDMTSTFEYTPRHIPIINGEVTPASCKSTPMPVSSGMGETMWGKTSEHETSYEVCLKSCTSESLREEVLTSERNAAAVLIAYMEYNMWYGNPSLLQYGILNHPLIQTFESPANGQGGSRRWKDKTNTQIMSEIRKYTKNMANPRIIVSESVYDSALGTGDESSHGSSKCDLRSACVMKLLSDQPDVNFDPEDVIEFTQKMDVIETASGGGAMLVYDAGVVNLMASRPIYTGAVAKSAKMVEAIRGIRLGGVSIDTYDSAYLITGI